MTPSGGMHLFFKADDPNFHYPTSVNEETRLDTRGDGGFVWLYQPNFQIPMMQAPDWVFAVTKKQNKKEKKDVSVENIVQLDSGIANATFNKSVDAIRNAGQGERNHTLNVS